MPYFHQPKIPRLISSTPRILYNYLVVHNENSASYSALHNGSHVHLVIANFCHQPAPNSWWSLAPPEMVVTYHRFCLNNYTCPFNCNLTEDVFLAGCNAGLKCYHLPVFCIVYDTMLGLLLALSNYHINKESYWC